MEHGSLEWHEWRERHANASEAAAVVGEGRFVPRNPRELSMVRNGTLFVPKTKAMQHGLDKEAGVLERLSAEMKVNGKGFNFKPEVLSATIDGIPMSASLDGRDGDTWVEVKVVMSDQSSYWTEACKGRIDKSVLWQMTQQYLVAREHGVANGYLHVVCNGDSRTIPYTHGSAREEALINAWKAVWPFITAGKVYGERNDTAWKLAAEAYLSAKQAMDAAEERVDAAKKVLLDLAGGQTEVGCGVSVTEVVKAGGYDYSKLDEKVLATLPRKKDTRYMMVNIDRKGKNK